MTTALPASHASDRFEQLYRVHRGQVFATCLRLCGDRVRAAELLQDVFVRIWEQWHHFDERDGASAWVHRVTLHTVFNVKRADRRRLHRVALAEDLGPTARDSSRAAAQAFATPAPVRRIAIEQAMEALTGRAREVFVLHDVEGHSTEDIAMLLRTAASTVRVHLARARATLRRELMR